MYVRMYTCMHVRMYVCTYGCMHVRMPVCLSVCLYGWMHGWMDVCLYVCLSVCMDVLTDGRTYEVRMHRVLSRLVCDIPSFAGQIPFVGFLKCGYP
jgi:hypothetical protein